MVQYLVGVVVKLMLWQLQNKCGFAGIGLFEAHVRCLWCNLKLEVLTWSSLCSICDYNDYLYSQPRLVNNSDSEDDERIEDDDSNDENNWKNDYPDEMSDDEREMRKAMDDCNVGEDLSSDDENGFVYSIDSEAIGFEDDADYCNVAR